MTHFQLALITALAASGVAVTALRSPVPTTLSLDGLNAHAIDGDTIRLEATGQRLRLAGIDAPELPGHCRPGRHCAPGDPIASQHALNALVFDGMTCKWSKLDYYHRPLVTCTTVDGLDVSAYMLSHNFAIPYPHP